MDQDCPEQAVRHEVHCDLVLHLALLADAEIS